MLIESSIHNTIHAEIALAPLIASLRFGMLGAVLRMSIALPGHSHVLRMNIITTTFRGEKVVLERDIPIRIIKQAEIRSRLTDPPRPPASLSVFLPDILTLRSVVSRTASAHPEVAVGANVLGTLAVRAAGHDTDIVASWKDARRGASVRLLRLLSRPKGKAYDSEDEVDVLTPALFRRLTADPADPPHLHPTALRFVSMPSSVLDRILRCFYGEVTAVVCLHRDAGLGLHLYQGPSEVLAGVVSVGVQRRSVSLARC